MNLVSASSLPPSTPLVVQHNALINARFQFGPLETRLFLHLLASIGRNDITFGLCRVEVSELLGEINSQNTYKLVREAVEEFATRTITIEQLSEVGRRSRQPDFVVLPLLSIAHYKGGEGAVEARFNDAVVPYLLELRDNFTKAQLTELLKIKNPNSHRIYWLLREYSAFGQRVVGLIDLKAMLKLGPGYDRWDNFKVRILDRAQQELQETDLPFTYELIRKGKAVSEIRFLFAPVSEQLPVPPPADGWEAALLAIGVAGKSLATIKTQIEAGYYDEGYIRYVLSRVSDQVRQGKVKKQAGAVYKALADGYFLNDYKQVQAEPISKPKVPVRQTITAKHREKLQNELADLKSSLKFVQHEAPEELYVGAKRQEAAAEIETKMASLQQQLLSVK
ncbi:MAG: RepB family plasmid replication initiator protein [Hymenobacter sp.]|nr:MAG: RepB family plasmid replication initiator protein [Hymenobacter sp.]